MNDEQRPLSRQVPLAEIHSKRGVSIVWVVPLVALLIGAWMGYQAWSEQGPTITISFASAEGLQKNQTRVKYKEVDIGKVAAIKLSDDLSRVLVTVEMDKAAESYLTEDTLFWIVRARVTADEISDLGTLFSGAYIGMEPGKTGHSRTEFSGLGIAPVLPGTLPGQYFILHAEDLGSINIGYPVYYRKIKVGQVVSYELDAVSDRLNIQVFIKAPFHHKVTPGSRFYHASGIKVGIDASGLKVSTESLAALLLGGIAFETPTKLLADQSPTGSADFIIYPDRESISQHHYGIKERYLLVFKDPVHGLSVGAPVEFQGVAVGQVLAVDLNFDGAAMEFSSPVLIELEPQRIVEVKPGRAEDQPLIEYLIEHGLRGQLKSGNLLTGQLLVDMTIVPTAPAEKIGRTGPYPVVPTVPMSLPLDELLASTERVLAKLEKLPAEEIAAELRSLLATMDGTLQQSKTLLGDINQDILPAAIGAMQQFQTSVRSLEKSFNAESGAGREMRKTLQELGKAARSIRVLSDYLQRHPEALLRGKGEVQ